MAMLAAFFVYGLEKVITRVAVLDGNSYVVWPIDGLALAILLMAPRRHWSWMLAAFGLGLSASQISEPLASVAIDAICNVLKVLLPALALPRFRTMDKWLAQPGVTLRFVGLAMVAAPAANALLAPLYFPQPAGYSYWYAALRWGTADMLGFALFTPLLLALLSRETWGGFRASGVSWTLVLIGLVTAGSWVLFHQHFLQGAFILYPLILGIGTELGLSGAIVGINIMALIAIEATVKGTGPFSGATAQGEVPKVFELQLFLFLSTAMVLPVTVARVRRLQTEAKLKRTWEAMEALATMDGLTGVANRRRFDAVLEVEWLRGARDRTPVSLLMIDADRFKAYNDTYGHLAGDACLRAIAKAISDVPKRPGDLVARYGGEEFAVLLPGADREGAALVAERVRRAVFELEVPHDFNEAKRATVSIGFAAVVPSDGMERTTLIDLSDRALYTAKHSGRNRVQFALEGMPVAV